MANPTIQKPFTHPFLAQFVWTPEVMPFTDAEIYSLDQGLSEYEQIYLNPDIEKSLITKNELLASFAISKAENSQLTLQEAQEVYNLLLSEPDLDFIGQKLRGKKALTQKDHDKLEFFNIAKTFRNLNHQPFSAANLTPELIKDIHKQLTIGLDAFKDYLPDFTIYKSGQFRDNDLIRVGDYVPATYLEIESGLNELLEWLKKNKTPTGVAIFHATLYALHPFNNGNKRVCRILEHLLLRDLKLNGKDLYSTSYYYHKQKPRYYKYLLYSLERKNLNYFVGFALEALVLSITSVVKTSLESKRSEFLDRYQLESQVRMTLKPLVKRYEIQFKNLFRLAHNKMARQTFVNHLQSAVSQGVLTKRESGRTTYYSLNFSTPEMETLAKWLKLVQSRLTHIPDDLRLV